MLNGQDKAAALEHSAVIREQGLGRPPPQGPPAAGPSATNTFLSHPVDGLERKLNERKVHQVLEYRPGH